MYDREDETWRFWVNDNDGTIMRGRLYQLPDDDGDQWRWYWDGDGMVAFIDGGYRDGTYAVTENDDTERAITAYRYSGSDALDKLAPRLADNPEARFIKVSLDRGSDLYALAWGGDPEGEWRDEIEAVYHGDVWRIEVEENVSLLPGEYEWHPADDVPEEAYGEDKAQAWFEKEFPLAEFPAHLLVEGSD